MLVLRLAPLRIQTFIRKLSSQSSHWKQPEGFDTGIKVFNCVAGCKVPLVVRNRYLATFYTCGPTVYDDTHLGHASCYVKLDIIQRLLRDYFGIPLLTAMNITDIDDKIIRKSAETGQTWQDIAQENESRFWRDLQQLDVIAPDYKVRVTEHLPEICQFIEELLHYGHAYKANDLSVYFDCNSFPEHGKLTALRSVQNDTSTVQSQIKKSNRDFVLWKSVNSGPTFDASFGTGRPGWHIECSAMATKLFGGNLDFHGGGWDLKFPHHENEESQSCAYHKCGQWVNYWLHTGQLRLQGAAEKMSKSLRNTISVETFLQSHKSHSFRMFCLLSNYRSNTEYSEEGIQNAHRVYMKLQSFCNDLEQHLSRRHILKIGDNAQFQERIKATVQAYDSALRDDFDTAEAIKVIQELMGFVNRGQHDGDHELDVGLASMLHRFMCNQLAILGLHVNDTGSVVNESSTSPVVDSVLAIREELRQKAKSSKDKSLFFLADYIRIQLANAGIEIKDRGKEKATWSWKR